jgi:hypothetical protein
MAQRSWGGEVGVDREVIAMKSLNFSKIMSRLATLVGRHCRELPGFGPQLRRAIDQTLDELGAEKCGKSGTPVFFIDHEYFRIGGRKLQVCTEDDMFVSLCGSKAVVEQVYSRILEKLSANERAEV